MTRLAAVLLLVGCGGGTPSDPATPDASGKTPDGQLAIDAGIAADAAFVDAAIPPDGTPPPPPLGHVLYAEGQLMSPITADVASNLAAISTHATCSDAAVAKIGDSMTATTNYFDCFASAGYDLGAHGDLETTRAHFTDFARTSAAATGGWTAADVLAGDPSPLASELAASDPRYGTVLLGTNDVRTGRTLDAFGADLWNVVDTMIAHGTIPILSTIPLMHGDPDSNARIPLFNRAIRALAQGRSLPLIDFNLALSSLAADGIGSDGIHPTVSPDGACALTTDGLTYGYNQRNLLSLEALDRTRRALAGETLDATAPRRSGTGTKADPFQGTLPLVDLGDTRNVETVTACGGSGRAIVYRLDLAAATSIDAELVDRGAVDVDVAITTDFSTCAATGDHAATATVGPGTIYIVVESHAPTTEGEFLLVVQ